MHQKETVINVIIIQKKCLFHFKSIKLHFTFNGYVITYQSILQYNNLRTDANNKINYEIL